eukprot:g317.t1
MGPRMAAELKAVMQELDKLAALGAGSWLDPRLSDAEWAAMVADRSKLLAHMKRVEFNDKKTPRTQWRIFHQAAAIPKKDDIPWDELRRSWRIILNFATKYGNDAGVIKQSYSHRGLRDVLRAVTPGSYISSLDFMKWFHQMPLSERSAQMCHIWVRGQRFRFDTMVMGLSISPYLGQLVTNALFDEIKLEVAKVVPGAIATSSMQDDAYIVGQSFVDTLRATAVAARVCGYYFAHLSTKKCEPIPHFIKAMLRQVVDTRAMYVYTPAATMRSLRQLCWTMLHKIRSRQAINAREVAAVLGTAIALADSAWHHVFAVQGLRDLQRRMLRRTRQDWDAFLVLDEEAEWMVIHDLHRLMAVAQWNGRPILPWVPHQWVSTDGSPQARGAVLLTASTAAATYDPEENEASTLTFRTLFNAWEGAAMSQNRREVDAAAAGIVSFAERHQWRWRVVANITDNMTCRRYLNKGGPMINLAHAARRLHSILWRRFRCKLMLFWAAGESLYLADGWSRTRLSRPVWRLNPRVSERLQQRLGQFEVDLFASADTRVCRAFIGPRPEPTPDQIAVDFFAPTTQIHRLASKHLFAMPPKRRLAEVLRRLEEARVARVSIAVLNPASNLPELPLLLQHSFDAPVLVPTSPELFQKVWEPADNATVAGFIWWARRRLGDRCTSSSLTRLVTALSVTFHAASCGEVSLREGARGRFINQTITAAMRMGQPVVAAPPRDRVEGQLDTYPAPEYLLLRAFVLAAQSVARAAATNRAIKPEIVSRDLVIRTTSVLLGCRAQDMDQSVAIRRHSERATPYVNLTATAGANKALTLRLISPKETMTASANVAAGGHADVRLPALEWGGSDDDELSWVDGARQLARYIQRTNASTRNMRGPVPIFLTDTAIIQPSTVAAWAKAGIRTVGDLRQRAVAKWKVRCVSAELARSIEQRIVERFPNWRNRLRVRLAGETAGAALDGVPDSMSLRDFAARMGDGAKGLTKGTIAQIRLETFGTRAAHQHWMRHSLASALLSRGVPEPVVRRHCRMPAATLYANYAGRSQTWRHARSAAAAETQNTSMAATRGVPVQLGVSACAARSIAYGASRGLGWDADKRRELEGVLRHGLQRLRFGRGDVHDVVAVMFTPVNAALAQNMLRARRWQLAERQDISELT